MKQLLTITLFLLWGKMALAGHITGGEMYYTYVGMSNGQYQYNVTLKLYKRCNISTAFPDPAIISVFAKMDQSRFGDFYVPMTRSENINLTNVNPCISNPPLVCFDIAYYSFTLLLPGSPMGYTISSQVNFRINGMNNLTAGYSGIGATYTAEIPGITAPATGIQNNSARFTGTDLVLVCTGNNFSYSFAATDPDGDQLYYRFCSAYRSTSQGGSAPPPEAPPYQSIPYNTPAYSESQPMGAGITLNSNSGLLHGIAPAAGQYVVTVCVEETRRGTIIATQRKDIQINVADCSITSAVLKPEYLLCDTSQTIFLFNESGSSGIQSSTWEVRDASNNLLYPYNGDTLQYRVADTGTYRVKLVINRNLSCADSTQTTVRVYPGFKAGFGFTGGCLQRPTSFSDSTRSVYGVPNSWSWDFGEGTVTTDISALQNPVYSYPQTGPKTARLIVSDTRGCRDTIEKVLDITQGPTLTLGFRDTLICINDPLILQASGTGQFTWSPAVNISDIHSPTPAVNPPVSITYYVDLNDGGCTNRDSVIVRVIRFVSLQVSDTSICEGDTTRLQIISDGLQYTWSPAAQLIGPSVKNPLVISPLPTLFTVIATVGSCSATGSFTVTPVPYPLANAGPDQLACFNTPVQLNGQTDGSSWSWSPARYLDDSSSLQPNALAPRPTSFIFRAFDTRGCPKPGIDTVLINWMPRLQIRAGNDTAVVTGQPLQFNATGGVRYNWSPAFPLSATNIANPVAIFNSPADGLQYQVTGFDSAGCAATAYMMIRVYQTAPTVFVPTAFTPNNDGRNDRLRPLGAGISLINYFSIYNRWGEQVFSTRQNGMGWDGNKNGLPQPTGTYVWQVKAIDYRGQPYFQKGIFTLIR